MKIKDIPVCLGGHVSPIYPSLCMDDATHILDTQIIGPVRIKPANDAVKQALDELMEKQIAASVCGYPRSTENCHHLEAYYASDAEITTPKLKAL